MSVTHVGHDHHAQAHPPHAHGPAGDAAAMAYPVYIVPKPSRFTRFFLQLYERSPRWATPVAIAACFFGGASLVWAINPTQYGVDYASTCIIKLTTGMDCPGCGGTRAFYYLMQGNVPEAARHHLMAVFAAPFLVWLYVAWSVKHTWGRQLPVPRITTKTIGVFLAAWMVFMVARNLPFAPFTSLYV